MTGNTVLAPQGAGIVVYTENQDLMVDGNRLEDIWSSTLGYAAAIYIRSQDSTVTIRQNRVTRGTKTAPLVNERGVWVGTNVGVRIRDQGNDFSAPASPWAGSTSRRIVEPPE